MNRKCTVKLTENDKKILKELVSKGVEKARKITRARILLIANEYGKGGAEEAAKALGVTPKTARTICYRFVEGGLNGALSERPRPGQPTIFSGKSRAKITALACTEPPEGYGKWSLRLLADKAVELKYVDSISYGQIDIILKKMK